MTSVAALVDDLLDKIDTVDPELRCLITVDHAGARRAATHADRRRTAGRPLGPLDGVPVAVKDNIDTGGGLMRTTAGGLMRTTAHVCVATDCCTNSPSVSPQSLY